MVVKRRHCIFCKNGKSFTGREHVFSEWVLKELNFRTKIQPFFKTRFNEISDSHIDSKSELHAKFNYDNFRSPYVCDGCNNGWMCELEGNVKPVLLPLIHGSGNLQDLNKSEKLLVARWALKTSCVIDSVKLSSASPYSLFDPNIIITRQTLPPGWAVFACTHKATTTISFFASDVWFVEGTITEELKEKLKGYKKTIFQLKNLILVTVYLGDERLKLKAVESFHFPIDINVNYQWVSQPASPSYTAYKNVLPNSTEDIMFKILGALSIKVS